MLWSPYSNALRNRNVAFNFKNRLLSLWKSSTVHTPHTPFTSSTQIQCDTEMRKEKTARSRWSRRRRNKPRWKGTVWLCPKALIWEWFFPLAFFWSRKCSLEGKCKKRNFERTTRTSTNRSSLWGGSTDSEIFAAWWSEHASMRKYGPLTALGPGIWPESCEQ